jgi:hypothetical protein
MRTVLVVAEEEQQEEGGEEEQEPPGDMGKLVVGLDGKASHAGDPFSLGL